MVEPRAVETDRLTPALFQQFRQRHPTGSLTSELVRVQDQTFVVQVHLHLEGKTLVSALAADPVLEVAEDRARQRALTLLGIDVAPRPEHPIPATSVGPQPETQLSQAGLPETALPKAAQPKAAPKATVPTQPTTPQRIPPKVTLPEVEAALEPEMPLEEADLTAPLDLLQDPAAEPVAASPQPQIPDPPPAQPAAMAAPISAPQPITTDSVPMPAPIDLSDVIAQTDVELKRLMWSVVDGREYLEQTYNKRSRHDLTDEELLAFLLHLEALPTPEPS
ncbi:MAG: hypothetical protein O2890_01465 [Cyanobacteria bacterium]|nr:hypothetical protein [Cyanobacteriota bacterium]MDA0865088.1 hypothetical protein [Cyanobacteriota bacterium]